jgi:uncharacterized membrane protein
METHERFGEVAVTRATWVRPPGRPARTESAASIDEVRRAAQRTPPGAGLARALGVFGIGLGLAQLLAPRLLTRLIGARASDDGDVLMRVLGARDLVTGLGILARRQPTGWVWARVAGDAIDLALLGAAVRQRRCDRERLAVAAGAVVGVTVLDVVAARKLARRAASVPSTAPGALATKGVHVQRTVTIDRPVDEVYRFWRDLGNLPRFMVHLESVQVLDDRRSRWTVSGPGGKKVEWDAEIVADQPGRWLSWRSLPGADVKNAGSVRFAPAPGERGTEIHVELHYDPPGGSIGRAIAKLFGKEPAQQVAGALRRLKQVIETGTIVHSDASIHRGPHPARPSRGGAPSGGAR